MKRQIKCCHCGKKAWKHTGHIRLAQKRGRPLYCSYRCSNQARAQDIVLVCQQCHKKFRPKWGRKSRRFCSRSCSGKYGAEQIYHNFLDSWRKGDVIKSPRVSGHIRRYLFEKYNSRCARCSWSETNVHTGRVPLEVEHIDGNWKNYVESNLTLLCPNCHSLTPTYKGRNKGHGRPSWKDWQNRKVKT